MRPHKGAKALAQAKAHCLAISGYRRRRRSFIAPERNFLTCETKDDL
jgi:hypothetical protein